MFLVLRDGEKALHLMPYLYFSEFERSETQIKNDVFCVPRCNIDGDLHQHIGVVHRFAETEIWDIQKEEQIRVDFYIDSGFRDHLSVSWNTMLNSF